MNDRSAPGAAPAVRCADPAFAVAGHCGAAAGAVAWRASGLAGRCDLRLLDNVNEQAVTRLLTDSEREPGPREETPLCCSACGHVITSAKERFPVRGSQTHRCTNPMGLAFCIGCFREAPGCAVVGQPTQEHTWFPGHAWRIALCANCHGHLGWRFQARGDDRFFGLILDRLMRPS